MSDFHSSFLHPQKTKVAYFSMEIAIDPHVPTYSGGLGVLAGDMLRGCADLAENVVGVTLLYRKGYFSQKIDEFGTQIEKEENWSPAERLKLLPEKITVQIEERLVTVQAWLYELSGITGQENSILFLDTDIPENSDYDRTLTHQLYGKDQYYRLCQEIILGIGGLKILQKLSFDSLEKYHMNEGHSALLALELYRQLQDTKKVRQHCVFTTHTTVPAGHDSFEEAMAYKALEHFFTNGKIKTTDVFHEGKLNMTHLALHFSGFVNGVAKIHREVSKMMFPNYHIESITNGVHSAFWTADPLADVYDKYIPDWRQDPYHLRSALNIPKDAIWQAHQEAKKNLLNFLQKKYHVYMNEEIFTIGFARRSATYKRGDMLLQDIEKLKQIATKTGGLQIIYGGKAHPHDGLGKEVIRKIVQKIKEVQSVVKICYVENYDMTIAQLLIPGVDIWLNTPMRPKEASGTSGMKAAHNGVPQFSTLDGWWLEGHIENVTGWSIGCHPNATNTEGEYSDVQDLYNKLEYVIIPTYYQERDKWLSIMRHTISLNASFFNIHRMVQQYVSNAYFN